MFNDDEHVNLSATEGEAMPQSTRRYQPSEAKVADIGLDFSRLFYMLYNHLDVQVQIADNKTNLILAANTILLTAFALNPGTLEGALGAIDSLEDALVLASIIVMLVSVITSVIFALVAARPRTIRPHRPNNLFFFGDIVQHQQQDFVAAFMEQSIEDVRRNIIEQIYARSQVVTRKYNLINRSVLFLMLAILFWTSTQVLTAIA